MIQLFDRGNNFVTTIPDPIIASYQKANRSLWSMKFSLHSSNKLIPKIEPMFFVDLEDASGEYIGKFRVLPTQEVVNQSTNEIEYTCYHAFHTLLDSVIFEEKEFEDVQPAVVMKWLLDRQKTPHWVYVDSPDLPNIAYINIEKQTGLLESAYDVLEELPVQYYFDFDTTVMPWRVSIKESTSVSSRLKEGYNLDSFEITKDPSVLINRLYLESSYYDEEQQKDILVTLKEANNGVPYLENPDLVDTYGPIEWYEKVDGITTSEGLKKYGTSMMDHMSGLVTTIRGDGYDLIKIMDPPIEIDTLRIGRKVFFETEDHGTYYLYVTEEAKSDVFGAPHSISITLSLTGDSKASASVTKSIFSSIKDAKQTAINALISADGKSLNTYSPYEPAYGNEGDTWFRENPDGSIDILIYKNGDWQEETSKAIFKKVQDQLDISAKDIEDARLKAENAAKGLIALDTSIDDKLAPIAQDIIDERNRIDSIIADIDPASTDPNSIGWKYSDQKATIDQISQSLVNYVTNADLEGKDFASMTEINNIVNTASGSYSTLAQYIDGELAKLNTTQKSVNEVSSLLASYDLSGTGGNASISSIRQSIEEHSSTIMAISQGSANIVTLDELKTPKAPYYKGWLWMKDAYDFTQGYDIIYPEDLVTLGELAEAGLFVSVVDKPTGEFRWNDFVRVSADSQFQMSDITQRLDSIISTVINNEQNTMSQIRQIANEITSTVKEGDLLSTINQQAGNVLIQVGTKSKLNITEAGTYMDTNFVKSSHIADAAITTAKIGNAQIIGAKIANATITSAKIASLDVGKISGAISSFIQSNWNAINSSISITGSQLVATHTDGTKTVLDATGLYTQVGSGKYRHSYLTYADHALKLNVGLDAPRKITLPAIWKGRKFDVFVSLASTDGGTTLDKGWYLKRITVGHNENTRDYTNGTFEIYGYAMYEHYSTGNTAQRYVDARYLVVQTF